MPRSGFYVIVDPQHRSAGTLPAEWFIHELMQDMKKPYYAGLLSAAELHGAAHHRPQEFQVVVPERALRPVQAGNVKIRFFGKGLFSQSRTMDIKTPTGAMRASTPETTAWDLVRYPRAAGGLANVVTVLAELAEAIDDAELRRTVRQHGDLPVAHRLGYIFERLGNRKLARALSSWARQGPLRLLDPSAPVAESTEDRKWRLLVNSEVEPEG
jgi:predicted transcriptional regulator of viral defense system